MSSSTAFLRPRITRGARRSIFSRSGGLDALHPSGTGDSRRLPASDSKQSHPERKPRGRYAQLSSSLPCCLTSKTVHSVPAESVKFRILLLLTAGTAWNRADAVQV